MKCARCFNEQTCAKCNIVKCEKCYMSDEDQSVYCNGCKKMWCEGCAPSAMPLDPCGFCKICEYQMTIDEKIQAMK